MANKIDKALDSIRNKARMEEQRQAVVEVAKVITDIDVSEPTPEFMERAHDVVKRERAKKRPSPQGGKFNRATFIIDPLLVARIKVVAAFENTAYKNVVDRALRGFLRSWQTSHPFVDLDKVLLNRDDE